MVFQSFDSERTWWRLFQKRVVCTNFDVYVFIEIMKYNTNLYIKMNTVLNSMFKPWSLYSQHIKMLSELVWPHISSLTSFTRSYFIEVHVPWRWSQESERSCICVGGIDFSIWFWNCSDSVLFLLDFGTVQTVCYFFVRFWNCSDKCVIFLFFVWSIAASTRINTIIYTTIQ